MRRRLWVRAADEAAHAGASDVVHGDMVLFKPCDDADVGQAERASAFKDQAERGPSVGSGRWCLICVKTGTSEEEYHKEEGWTTQSHTGASKSLKRIAGVGGVIMLL